MREYTGASEYGERRVDKRVIIENACRTKLITTIPIHIWMCSNYS